MNYGKDSQIKGRKFHGTPYLKLKRVRISPRRTIKQKLRSAIELAVAKLPEKAFV
jgi:hypothetical protein